VATAEPAAAFDGAAAALVVVPAQHLRETLARVSPPATLPLLLCAKGIERGSGKLTTEVRATWLRRRLPFSRDRPSRARWRAACRPR
jgi:glycerol-3-phosphate dehydrogenase (NAD(P)+)